MLRYRIYQAESETGNAFKELAEIGAPDPSKYVMVYENGFTIDEADEKGDIHLLNDLYRIFNMGDNPEDYLARSISISDVIELYEETGDEANHRFYYCDRRGFKKVSFDSKKAENPAKSDYVIMIVPEDETDLLYSKEKQKREFRSIGYLRGDFSKKGNHLWTTFTDHCGELKNVQFRIQLNSVVNYLIEIGMFKSFHEMTAYFYAHPEYKLGPKHREGECGFKIETERFKYYFRTILRQGDDNVYCFPYARENNN